MTQQDTPFAPFMPPNQTPTMPMPEDAPHTASDPNNKKKRKKANPIKQSVVQATVAAAMEQSGTKRRRRKLPEGAKVAKRQPKYDLQTILRVASTLKEADQKVFEKLLGELSAMPKASRGRIMTALSEVFG